MYVVYQKYLVNLNNKEPFVFAFQRHDTNNNMYYISCLNNLGKLAGRVSFKIAEKDCIGGIISIEAGNAGKGIGSALQLAAEYTAVQQGCTNFKVETVMPYGENKNNTFNFYKKNKFVITEKSTSRTAEKPIASDTSEKFLAIAKPILSNVNTKQEV